MPAPVSSPGTQLSPEALPLRDIHLPEPVSWWPLAPGWWLLLIAIILLVALFVIVKKIRYSRRIKRASREALQSVTKQYQQDRNKVHLAQNLSTLLRRASISFYPRRNTAGLTGRDWLTFLDTTMPDNARQRFNSPLGEVLLSAPYMPENIPGHSNTNHQAIDFDAEALLELCKQWLVNQPVKKDALNRIKSADKSLMEQSA